MTQLHIYLFLDSLGGGEILLIMIFVLFFFGSSKIPDIAKGLGKGMREFKDAMGGVQRDIEQSIRETEIKKQATKQVDTVEKKEKENNPDAAADWSCRSDESHFHWKINQMILEILFTGAVFSLSDPVGN